MEVKEKLFTNILICKELLNDFEKELEKIYECESGYTAYSGCNKDKMNRNRIIIGEKLLEIEKAIKENKQESN